MRKAESLPAFLLSFIVFAVYTGASTLYSAAVGLISSIVIGSILGALLVRDWRKALNPKRWLLMLLYIIKYFVIDELKAHALVLRLGLSPSMPVRPAIVRVPLKSKTDYAKTLVALSITNTPGTVVVDLDEKNNVFYVHWIYAIDVSKEVCYKQIAEPFDKWAVKIFD